jgi:hypothetical protein
MNTARLKRFAPEARLKLIQQVGARLDQVLGSDTAALREKAEAVKQLREAIKESGRDQVIDRVAYTWFNRLMALRFMDANDYQPIGLRVVSPKDGYTLPELLDEAKQGNVPEGFVVDSKRVYDLLDGRIPSPNGQNEAYKELLIAACNHLHTLFPFLFERLSDYSELLLPDDLTSEFSIVHDVCAGMTKEDCAEVEAIGWLYQFYIAERKDEVFAAEGKVSKEDIPAATQLFTPRWIVEYMVQNTVGKLWLQNRPNSSLREHMPYFIDSPSLHATDFLKVKGPEDLTLLDSACGSGHILVYGFELFTKIYEEEGYTPADIPKLIIEHNLFGFEIDERAAQLAGFALLMKARGYHRRFLRAPVKPNVLCYRDVVFTQTELGKVLVKTGLDKSSELQHDLQLMANATNFGSLIVPHTDPKLIEQGLKMVKELLPKADLFERDLLERLQVALEQLQPLARKYHCVVDNPPYMGGGNMNKDLADFVKINYPAGKADLMACFIESGLKQLYPGGLLGMINLPSWLFLSSFEKVRAQVVEKHQIDSLLHMGRGIFGVDWGSTCFVLQNAPPKHSANFFRLHERNFQLIEATDIAKIFLLAKANDALRIDFSRYRGIEGNRENIDVLVSPNGKQVVYQSNQLEFTKIPASPIGYWFEKHVLDLFVNSPTFHSVYPARVGMQTANNERFLRRWIEVNQSTFGEKWAPYLKGGGFRRWAGFYEYACNVSNNAESLHGYRNASFQGFDELKKVKCSWNDISTGHFTSRYTPIGMLNDIKSHCFYPASENEVYYPMALTNSTVFQFFMDVFNPGISYQVGDVRKVPLKKENEEHVSNIAKQNIEISKLDWDSHENSWDFLANQLVMKGGSDLEEAYDAFDSFWKLKYVGMHRNEEVNNLEFIRMYGLQAEVGPSVPFEEVTILQDELDRRTLANFNGLLERDQETGLVISYDIVKLPFDKHEIFAQFVSYAIGCMFGRYSLDKEGLLLANQGETLEDYLKKVGKNKGDITFLPDADNIIPVLDDEWFEDDVVGRFHAFLKATFGTANFEKNLAFVEECLGKDIRKYFTKDFYSDHVQRYSKRPIYWMFSSPKGAFSVLVYMHRYTPDTLNRILNNYLRPYKEKLKTQMEHLDHQIETGSASEQNRAAKEKDKLRNVLLEVEEYERDVLYPLATERIAIDLDDGVLVNYNKFGKAIKEVAGLNDKKAKDKVKKFDWIDTSTIR